jgi:hypothetical protein
VRFLVECDDCLEVSPFFDNGQSAQLWMDEHVCPDPPTTPCEEDDA